MLQLVKRRLLPTGLAPRRIPIGLGRGLWMDIDFERELRLYLGLYEIEVARHIRRLCQPRIVTYDVGAQHGYDALVFANLTGGPVLSFECDPRAIERMRHTFTLNQDLQRLVTPVEAMVGAGDGSVAIDDYVADGAPAPGFIKVDVEGAEGDVLQGAQCVLREHRPSLLVEVHSRAAERECGEILVETGYKPLLVNQRRLLPDHRPIEHNRWIVAQ